MVPHLTRQCKPGWRPGAGNSLRYKRAARLRISEQRMNVHDHPAFEPRVEDDQLVRGGGRFVEDAAQPGQAFAAFVRSPHAFAKIVAVNAEAARSAKGVLAVLTAADMEGGSAASRGIRR